MTLRSVGVVLAALGVVCFVFAAGWWYLFFEQMLGTAVKQASACFYFTSTKCKVADAIDFFFDIPAYSPSAFWLSASLIGTGLFLIIVTAPALDRDTVRGTDGEVG